MTGTTYLHISLIVAGIGLALGVIGPLAQRWHKKLESDLRRMKQGDRRIESSALPYPSDTMKDCDEK